MIQHDQSIKLFASLRRDIIDFLHDLSGRGNLVGITRPPLQWQTICVDYLCSSFINSLEQDQSSVLHVILFHRTVVQIGTFVKSLRCSRLRRQIDGQTYIAIAVRIPLRPLSFPCRNDHVITVTCSQQQPRHR